MQRFTEELLALARDEIGPDQNLRTAVIAE
jgi:hypothetical protein